MNYGYNDSSASEQFFHHQQQLNNQNSGYQVPLPVYEDSSDDEQQNQTFNNNNNSATSTAASTTSTTSSSSSSNPDQPIETNTRNDPSHQLSSRKRKKTQKKRAIQKRQNLSSGYRFVYKAGKRWQVRTKYKSKQFYVGVYNDKVIAARAADFIIHREKWPPYMLNFPDEGPVSELPKVVTKGRINNNPQPARNKTGLKGVYENVRDGQPSRYYVQVFKNNATYTLSEKFDSKDSAANAFDKMAVSLGRTRNFLNKPENFDTYVKQRDAELDLLVLSYLHNTGQSDLVSELTELGMGNNRAGGASFFLQPGALKEKVAKGQKKSNPRSMNRVGVNKITSVSAVSVIASMVEVSDARNLKANNAHKESTIKEFEKSNKSELFYSRTNVSTSGHRKKGITRSGRRSGSSSTDGNVVHGKSMLIESDGEQSKSGPAAEV